MAFCFFVFDEGGHQIYDFLVFHFVIVPLCKMTAVGFFLNSVCQIKKYIIYHGSTKTCNFNDLVVNPIIWWLLKKYFHSPIYMYYDKLIIKNDVPNKIL